ncbi:CARDB domain-containing protein [Nocardioides sp. YIM 152588]|uniref:CARDB domain-containing protein n=1 Tax=Nocardioides sp. YIM 152588 TaxID=3158259 RepID=UPI0032E3BB43
MRARALLAALVLAGTTTVVSTGVTTTLTAAPAHAAARPDLTVAAVTAPARVAEGKRLKVGATVRAASGARAGATRTRFLLSRDRKAGGADRVLATVKTSAVPGGGRRTVTARGPARVATGRWYVLACADATRRVRERREGNNCRASSAPVRVAAAPTPPPGDGFAHVPDPIDVAHEVDAAAARSFTPGTYGGEVTATGADGTRYRLVVPRDALLSPVTITLSPVASLEGAPVTGPVRAVEITPHGLMLLEPATLTITPPAGTDLSASSGFLFDEGGLDFHAFPAEIGAGSATVHLTHFSTPGIAAPSGDRASPGAGRWPRRAEAQFEATLADLLAGDRGDVPDLGDRLKQLVEAYERDVVQPALRAGTACGAWRAARTAVATALGLSRRSQLLGLPSEVGSSDLTVRLIREVSTAQADCAYRSCVADHKVGAVQTMMAVMRHKALTGDQAELDRLAPMLRECLTFQVEVRGTAAAETHWADGAAAGLGGQFYYAYDKSARLVGGGTITLRLNPAFGLSGRTETRLTEFRHVEDGRDADGDDIAPFTVRGTAWDPGLASARLDLDLNAYLPSWADGWTYFPPPIAGQVLLDLRSSALDYGTAVNGPLTETYTRTSGGSTTTAQTSSWVGALEALVNAQLPQSGLRPAVVFGPRDQAGATFVDRTWSRTRRLCHAEAEAQCDETTTLRVILTHTPGA